MIFFLTLFADACSDAANKTFFGLVPWYHYLKVEKEGDTCGVPDFQFFPGPNNSPASDVPLVLLAVIDDLLRIAGIVAIFFVINGGIKYITSQGSPDETAKAQSTILNAVIGLAIALVSIAAVSFIGSKFGSR